MRRRLLITAAVLVGLAVLVSVWLRRPTATPEPVPAPRESELNEMSSSLTKLSAAVESLVRYESPPQGATDEQLLTLATAHDPALLVPFAAYRVRVQQTDGHAVVMVCTRDGARSLLEDSGCTGNLDIAPYRDAAQKPCEFTLTALTVCGAPTADSGL